MRLRNKGRLKEKARQLLAEGLQNAAQGVSVGIVASALASAAYAHSGAASEQGYIYNQIKQQASELAGSNRAADCISRVFRTRTAKDLRQSANISLNMGTLAVNAGIGTGMVNVEGSANSVVFAQDPRPEAAAAAALAQGSSNATVAASARNRSNPTVTQLNLTSGASASIPGGSNAEESDTGEGDTGKRARSPSPSPLSTRRKRLSGHLLAVSSRSDSVEWRHQDVLTIIRTTSLSARREIGRRVFSFPPPRQKAIFEEFSNLILPVCVGFISSRIHDFPKRVVQAACAAASAVIYPPCFENGGWDISRCANLMSRLPADYRLPTEADSGIITLKKKRNNLAHTDENGFPPISDNEFIGIFDVGATILHTLGCSPEIWSMFDTLEGSVKEVVNRKHSWCSWLWN